MVIRYRKGLDIGSYAAKNIANNDTEKRSLQNQLFESKAALPNYNYHFINMTNLMCHNGKCNIIDGDGNSFYSDRRHTTRSGTKYVGQQLKEMHIFPNTVIKQV